MIDVILDSVLNKYLYLQIIPAFIGLLFVARMDSKYKYFVLLLWYGVFNEIFALYYGRHINLEGNKVLYNIYNIVYFALLFGLFYKETNRVILKKVIIGIIILYFLSIIYELFFKQVDYHSQAQVSSYIIGSFGILICVFYYFLNILVSNNLENVNSDLLFWIAIAHFFYYLGFTPIKIGENYYATFKEYGLTDLRIAITIIKSFILSIGFICSRQRVQ